MLERELLINAMLYFIPNGSVVGAIKATGTLTLAADIAADETVTIGAKTYTCKAVPGTTANAFKLGANRAATLDNLIAAINLAAGAGDLYGSETTEHPTITAIAGAGDTMVVTAKIGGTNGNAIVTTETLVGAGNQWGAATLTGGVSGDTASISSKPALDEDWKEHEFACISRVKRNPIKKSEELECGRGARGGYAVTVREWIVRDTTEFQAIAYHPIHHQLSFGLAAPIVLGVAQPVNRTTFREIVGWMRIVAFTETGAKFCTQESWECLRLGDVPEWKNETGKPIYQMEFIGSGDYDLDDVVFH